MNSFCRCLVVNIIYHGLPSVHSTFGPNWVPARSLRAGQMLVRLNLGQTKITANILAQTIHSPLLGKWQCSLHNFSKRKRNNASKNQNILTTNIYQIYITGDQTELPFKHLGTRNEPYLYRKSIPAQGCILRAVYTLYSLDPNS
jgi:hypothetical protein